MAYSIRIKNGKNSTYHARRYLASQGFKFNHQDRYWGKTTEDWQEVCRWFKYGKKNGFRVTYQDTSYSRSNSYRKDFFDHYKPFYKDRYFCIYCGKLLPENKIQQGKMKNLRNLVQVTEEIAQLQAKDFAMFDKPGKEEEV